MVADKAADDVPATQSVHGWLPIVVLYLPATHAVHTPWSVLPGGQLNTHASNTELPAGETPVAPHGMQALAFALPTVVEKVPAAQSVQATLPPLVLYFPATHAEHVPPFAPVNPALHVQESRAGLEAGAFAFEGQFKQVDKALVEYFPLEQFEQAVVPLTFLNLPAMHAVHVPPFAPVNPTLQVQAVMAVLATGEVAFEGHFVQVPWTFRS